MIVFITGNILTCSDPGYIRWYLGILHGSAPIKKFIFMSTTVHGVPEVVRKWAIDHKISFAEYPEANISYLERYEDIDKIGYCLALEGYYDQEGTTAYKGMEVAREANLTILFPPKITEK